MQVVRIGLDLGEIRVRGSRRRQSWESRLCERRCVAMRCSTSSRICRDVWSAWKPRTARITGHAVLTDLGHEVRLISPQFVTPYVKSNKNDRNDAEAICEAVGRPSMRFVPPKSTDQLAIQAVHRIRRRLVGDRVRLVNQIRGLLSEHGIVIARDISQLRRGLAVIWGTAMTASAKWSDRS